MKFCRGAVESCLGNSIALTQFGSRGNQHHMSQSTTVNNLTHSLAVFNAMYNEYKGLHFHCEEDSILASKIDHDWGHKPRESVVVPPRLHLWLSLNTIYEEDSESNTDSVVSSGGSDESVQVHPDSKTVQRGIPESLLVEEDVEQSPLCTPVKRNKADFELFDYTPSIHLSSTFKRFTFG